MRGPVGVGLELLAELADLDAQILHVDRRRPRPAADQELVGQHLAGVLHQHAQDVVFAAATASTSRAAEPDDAVDEIDR